MSYIEKTVNIPGSLLNAGNITYDNTNSGLSATTAQDAIDKINTKINDEIQLREEADNEIRTSTENDLYGTKPGGLKLLKMGGNTQQKQLRGKNLSSISSGTFTRYALDYCNLPSGTYTISALISSTDTDSEDRVLELTKGDGTIIYETLRDNSKFSCTYTFDSGLQKVVIYASNLSENAVNDTLTISYFQIEEGDTATDYEEYCGGTPSPSPNYPQSINNTGDCVEMIQGCYATGNGNYSFDSKYICSKNKTECKGGDEIEIITDFISYPYVSVIWFNDNNYLSINDKTIDVDEPWQVEEVNKRISNS